MSKTPEPPRKYLFVGPTDGPPQMPRSKPSEVTPGDCLLRTAAGLKQVEESHGPASTQALTADDGVCQVTMRALHSATCYRVQIGYRTIAGPGSMEVLTVDGWRRLDALSVGDRAVTRCGTKKPPMEICGVKLGPKHALRLVEAIEQVPFSVVYEPQSDQESAIELHGVVVRSKPGSREG